MRYRNRSIQILIGILVGLIATACSNPGGIDPTSSPSPEPTATDPPSTAVVEPAPTMTSEPPTAVAEPGPASTPTPATTGEPSPVLAHGTFMGADAAHQGEGSAEIVRREGGDLVLELEDFSVTDGPDLYVYLSSSTAPGSGGALGTTVDLGLLQSTTGDQTYDIPDDITAGDYSSVVIYCLAYEVVFAHAPLSSAAE